MNDEVYIAVSAEAAEDRPVADIVYRGVQWASLSVKDGESVLTLYATEDGFDVPVAIALASIDEARRRLR